MTSIVIKTSIGEYHVYSLASMLTFVKTFVEVGEEYTIEINAPKPTVEYVREFNCGLSGDRTVIIKLNGVEIAVSYDEYISKYYSETEHHEKIQAWEDKQNSGVPLCLG